jgi:transposase
MKMSIGVDLHKTQFTVCFLSEDRRIKDSGMFPTNEIGYRDFLMKIKDLEDCGFELQAAVESTGNARYFKNKLNKVGIPVTVVNTVKFKVVNESVKKTDKHDALTLAEFLEKDMLPESRLCSQESEDLRRILKSRSILVKTLVSLKNQIHGLLLGYGIESKRGQLQSKRERQRILCGLVDHECFGNAARAVEPLFSMIDQVAVQVKEMEKVLEELIADDEDVALLQTIPGVGIITASTIRAYTDDIQRFDSPKQYAAYIGLVPWVQNSNETIHHGHITKRGSVELRTAYVQSVLGMVRSKKVTGSYRLMTSYRSMKQNKGSGASIIATARKMSTIVYRLLKYREPFDPSKMVPVKKYQKMQAAAFQAAKAG